MITETARQMLREFDKHREETQFQVENKKLWENEEDRTFVLKRVEFDGKRFEYADGIVIILEMSDDEFSTKQILKNRAYKRYCLQNKVDVQNEKMDALLAQLTGYKEVQRLLPYHTRSADTVIFLFPKNKPQKDFAGFEYCDAVIYDRSYEEYFKVRTMGHGFTEIISNGVACRTGLSDGGYFVRLRENCIFHMGEEGIMYLLNQDATIHQDFTEEQLEEALQIVYRKSLKNL